MIVTRRSPMTGKITTMNLPITRDQFMAWMNGALIQDAMPTLTADEREFIINGMTPDDSARLAAWSENAFAMHDPQEG